MPKKSFTFHLHTSAKSSKESNVRKYNEDQASQDNNDCPNPKRLAQSKVEKECLESTQEAPANPTAESTQDLDVTQGSNSINVSVEADDEPYVLTRGDAIGDLSGFIAHLNSLEKPNLLGESSAPSDHEN